MTTSEDLAEKINADFESLNDILGNRVKRSWYKTIQNTVKIIHGLINENEVRTYEYVIKQKVENNTRLLNEIQGKFGVLNSDLTKQNNKLQELEELVTKMNTDLNKLYQERTNYKLYTEEVKKLQIEQYLQAINSYGISIHADIQTIITAILFAKRNTVHPKVLSPKRILDELILATKHLSNNLHFPYALLEHNTEGIIGLSDIKVFRVNQLLVFIICNPLTVDETFDLYKLIPYPVKFENDQYLYIKPKDNYLVINEYRVSFTLISSIEKCKAVHPELFICQVDRPLFNRFKNRVCEAELLMETETVPKNCDLRIINLENEIWEKIHYFNTWIYVVPQTTELKVICSKGIKELLLYDSGVITLNNDCYAFTPFTQIFPNQIGFDERFYSVVPKANLTEFISPFKSELESFILKNSKNPTTSVKNFEDLNNAGTSIQFILQENKIKTLSMNMTVIVILTISITIIIMLSLIYVISKRIIKGRKNIEKATELVPMNDNNQREIDITEFGLNEPSSVRFEFP